MGLWSLRTLTFAGLACLIIVAVPARASLIGQTITCSSSGGFFEFMCDAEDAVVGAGTEFVIFEDNDNPNEPNRNFLSIDVGDKSVVMTLDQQVVVYATGGADETTNLGGFFWSNDPDATIIGIENFVASNVFLLDDSPFSADRITVSDNSLSIFWGNSKWDSDDGFTFNNDDGFAFISFDLVTTHGVEVPEPASLALFGFGLAGLGFMTRRRRRKELAA